MSRTQPYVRRADRPNWSQYITGLVAATAASLAGFGRNAADSARIQAALTAREYPRMSKALVVAGKQAASVVKSAARYQAVRALGRAISAPKLYNRPVQKRSISLSSAGPMFRRRRFFRRRPVFRRFKRRPYRRFRRFTRFKRVSRGRRFHVGRPQSARTATRRVVLRKRVRNAIGALRTMTSMTA